MMELLMLLEPYRNFKKTVLFDELGEFTEVLFIGKGTVLVGYEINKETRYCLKYDNYCVLGGYEIMYQQRSAYIYTAMTNIQGYSVRRHNWLSLMDNHPEIATCVKMNTFQNYSRNVKNKVNECKRQAINEYVKRNDH